MDENNYMIHFEMIAAAGQSRSNSMEAIREAREGNFDAANEFLKEANENLTQAHKLGFDMLQEEANGNSVEINIVAIHAQDHLTMATIMHDLAEEMIKVYQRLEK